MYVRSYAALLVEELDYPENIMYEISGETSHSKQQISNLENILQGLDSYKQTILELYYKDKTTYRQIGEKLGISGQRVSQIKRKTETFLKQPSNLNKIFSIQHKAIDIDSSVEELDLSVRAYNCCKRNGFNTAKDIEKYIEENGEYW